MIKRSYFCLDNRDLLLILHILQRGGRWDPLDTCEGLQ